MTDYQLGDVVHLTFDIEIGDTDTDPSAINLTVLTPASGAAGPFTPTHDGTGRYHYDYAPPAAGLGYRWIAQTTGTAQAVATGSFDVYDPASTDPPLVGVLTPWCDAAAVRSRPGCDTIDQALLDAAARSASGILYALTGRQFAGAATKTVRPNARPGLLDSNAWGLLGGYGYYGTWGTCSYAYGVGYGGAALAAWTGHTCRCAPPEVELGAYPVTSVEQVKINGQVIPTSEYRIDDYRLLVRQRATPTTEPTEQSGWPTCQRLDLPDTQPGTFSVTFTYGTQPPAEGKQAAISLAAELALLWDNSDNETRLPTRVQTLTRQGESMTILDPLDFLTDGRTGIPDVDYFIAAANPARLQRRATVWSPDTAARPRRTTWTAS